MLLLIQFLGQEEENAQFLVDNDVAIWIKKGDNIARALKNLYRDTEHFNLMKQNTILLAKPQATDMICQILLHEI